MGAVFQCTYEETLDPKAVLKQVVKDFIQYSLRENISVRAPWGVTKLVLCMLPEKEHGAPVNSLLQKSCVIA